MQFNFNKLEPGSQICLIAIGVAFISLFLPWVDWLGRNLNAFSDGFFFASLPLLYPLLTLVLGKAFRTIAGVLAVILSTVAGSVLLYIYIVDSDTDPKIGIFIFLLANLGALYGLVRPILLKR